MQFLLELLLDLFTPRGALFALILGLWAAYAIWNYVPEGGPRTSGAVAGFVVVFAAVRLLDYLLLKRRK